MAAYSDTLFKVFSSKIRGVLIYLRHFYVRGKIMCGLAKTMKIGSLDSLENWPAS